MGILPALQCGFVEGKRPGTGILFRGVPERWICRQGILKPVAERAQALHRYTGGTHKSRWAGQELAWINI
jgi:hypothetical protein